MAPGIGGNGSAGSGGRQTGTVPKKTKSRNECTRDYNGTSWRDYQHFNHMPNNLIQSTLDWQPVNESLPHTRTRKESNTSASRYSEFDAEEHTVSQDNLWLNATQRNQAYNSDDDEVSQASWAESRYKSNNLGLPDRAQIDTRLHQIRDYVSQTTNMMDNLRATRGQGELDSYPSHQLLDSPHERTNNTAQPSIKPSETARKNELKKQVQASQLKLQELQEQQAALKALRHKAQEQLKAQEARTAQLAQVVQGLDEEEVEACEMQNKLDELQVKKQQLDQLLAQFSNNVSEDLSGEECERDVENRIAELNTMRETLAILQSNNSAQLQPQASQEHNTKKAPCVSVEKSNAATEHSLITKTQQLQVAKFKLQQLQNLLQTVEELRESGQPIPDSILQLMGNSHLSEHSSSPTHPDRSDMSSQELNVSQPLSERLVNACDRREVYSERSCRSLNSCERQRVNNQPSSNAVKHNNHEDKLGTKMQLEELLRNHDLNMPQPLQSSSFQESSTSSTWINSTQGTMDENYNPEFSGEVNDIASTKNPTGNLQPHNLWRKPSTGSGTSRLSWTSPYVPQEIRRQQPMENNSQYRPSSPPTLPQPYNPPQFDSHWAAHQINQLQNQLQQMTGLYKNAVEKQHNCSPPWMVSSNMSTALGPYCQYIASATQWQQQQLLVHSLNQCCQLIWHQQSELAALKEALRLLQQPPQESQIPSQTEDLTAHHSNLRSTQQHSRHILLKPSLSAGPTLASPAVVSSAHSLPNLASPQTTPTSPTPVNNRNLISSPTATVLSLPTTLNNGHASAPGPTQNPNLFFNHSSQFTDPNFVNLYPPYGNNLNFEFPSPVNFFPNPPEPFITWASSQPQPTTTLNNQVPPGNRANNYWDNFRRILQSYSRQNLLSNSGKSNDGLPQSQAQRTPLERFLNTDPQPPPSFRSWKERLNAQNRQTDNLLLSGAPLLPPPETTGDLGEASGYNPHLPFQHNLYADPASSLADSKTQDTSIAARHQFYSPHSFQHNVCNETESQTSQPVNENRSQSLRVVNSCEATRGSNKRCTTETDRKAAVTKRNYIEVTSRVAKVSQLNNYRTVRNYDANMEAERPVNQEYSMHVSRNCEGNDGHCLMASDKGVRRKENKGNVSTECKTETNAVGDSLEECVYSEVAALISVNEWRPQFLLQLFKDLRLLSSCADPSMQAALSSIHTLAARTFNEERNGMNDEATNSEQRPEDSQGQLPHRWSHKEAPPQLPTNCAKLDWEVRSILVEMLPFIKSQLTELCGSALLEALRKLILHLVPSQSTQEQLDAQLEDALHKFHGCRLVDVYEELLTVVADVLISELTFLRLVNTVHHSSEQQAGEELGEEEEEGAVGGEVGDSLPPTLLLLHPTDQPCRAKSETVSEADLAEADQSRHTGINEDEERGDSAEGVDHLEEEASGRDVSMANCSTNIRTETEASWTVEQDKELGLDHVPTRLHDPTCPEMEEDSMPPRPDPGPI